MGEPEELSIERRTQPLPTSYSENSLHELEEFHDPFSDISLFLSQKISSEIAAHGSSQDWSAQIEQDLLRKILPEFKVRFPRYRLGLFALKKAFEKAAYFYEKLYGHKNLSANSLIRENLRTQLEVGMYNSLKGVSEQIAQNVGECLATLQGKKPNMLGLMAKSYSALKALQKESSPQNPFHTCDARDSLIVKTQIETIAEHPAITYRQLQAVVEQKLSTLHELPAPHKNAKIETLIASHLGKKWSATLKAKLCEKELQLLRKIVQEEHETGNPAPKLARHLEMILLMAKSCYGDHPPSKLLDFYQKEILLEFEESGFSETQHQIEQVSLLDKFLKLPLCDAKALLWALIAENTPATSPLLIEMIDNEIATTILQKPDIDFWSLVQNTLLKFKKAKEILETQEGLEEKIEFWAIQGELIFLELNLPAAPKRPTSSQFIGFTDEFEKREWIHERWNAYRNTSGSPVTRYKSLNTFSIDDRLPLLPQ